MQPLDTQSPASAPYEPYGVPGRTPRGLAGRVAPGRTTMALLGLLAVGLVAGSMVWSQHRAAVPTRDAKDTLPVMTVAVTRLATRTLTRRLELSGSVTPWELLPVVPVAIGLKISHILVDEGEKVTRGQLLALLDDSILRAQQIQARARLAQAAAQLAKVLRPNRRQDIVALRAGLAQAEAARNSARDLYNRIQALQADGAVTASELITREANYRAAEAAVEQARQRLSMAQEGSRVEDIALAQAAAAEARGAVAFNEAQLAQTRVVAPEAGFILSRGARLGEVTSGGQRLFTIVRDGRLQVEAQVSEADLGLLRAGQLAAVLSSADPGLRAAGRVREIAPAVDAGSRLGTVKVNVPPGTRFKVGQFVRARIEVGRLEAPAVPAPALVQKGSGAEVFVLEGDLARSRPVQTGARDGAWVQILAGLKPGERVVTAGAGYLKDGDKVRVVPPLHPHLTSPSKGEEQVSPPRRGRG